MGLVTVEIMIMIRRWLSQQFSRRPVDDNYNSGAPAGNVTAPIVKTTTTWRLYFFTVFSPPKRPSDGYFSDIRIPERTLQRKLLENYRVRRNIRSFFMKSISVSFARHSCNTLEMIIIILILRRLFKRSPNNYLPAI